MKAGEQTKPFQIFGHPSFQKTCILLHQTQPKVQKSSKLYGQVCYGWDVSGTTPEVIKKVDNRIQLSWLLNAYKLFPEKDKFFILPKSGNADESFFNKLAGNATLMQQIKEGKSETEIRKSWEPKLNAFKKIREKYLLYP